VVVVFVLPLMAWALMARTLRFGWMVALAVLAWIGVVVGIAAAFPRARAEMIAVYLPVALAICWLGRRAESRALRPDAPREGGWAFGALVALTVTATCLCGPALFYVLNSEPFLPSSDELLPLPQGLHATPADGDLPCGSGVCERRFTVAGEAGQPMVEVRQRVVQHLTARGWEFGSDGWACRPAGLLLDRTTMCASVFLYDGVVHVTFEGARAWA